MHDLNLDGFLKKENIPYKNEALYWEAMTHASYANERRHLEHIECNERLEFLGDAALQLCCSEYLFNIEPRVSEGKMSRIRSALVREEALVDYADLISLPTYVRIGNGEEKSGGRQRAALKADAFEALIGAIYLDLGFEAVSAFLTPILDKEYQSLENKDDDRDYKSRLQEFVQADSKRAISYRLLSVVGPPHEQIFETSVLLDDVTLGVGKAQSKKKAEQSAARAALEKLAVSPERSD